MSETKRHWSDGVSDEKIAYLKNTGVAFMYHASSVRKIIQEAKAAGDAVFIDEHGCERIGTLSLSVQYHGLAYRIRPDFKRPEPPPEWIECDVYATDHRGPYWHFVDHSGVRRVIGNAPGMIGFGGVQFECSSDWWSQTALTDSDDKPYRPTQVRFHRPTLVKHGLIESEVKR